MRNSRIAPNQLEPATPPKRNTNLSLSASLVVEAQSLGINLSRACERGLAAEIAERRAALWLEQNREAITAWNEVVEQTPLPLERFRQF